MPRAERYYQLALESYRWHGVYWSLGLAQLELALRPDTPTQVAEKLVASAREALATGRRIFPNEERFFLELDTALRAEDTEAAVNLSTELMDRNPGLLIDQVFPKIAERSIKKDPISGKMKLDPVMEEFFRVLLPHLDRTRLGILLYALTILDYGNAEDLAQVYAEKAKEELTPIESIFIDYRILKNPEDLADLSEELEIYRDLIESDTRISSDKRAIYLSDLQRFAPNSADLSAWKEEVELLFGVPDLPFAKAVSGHALAREAYERGDWIAVWRKMMEVDSRMSWQMQNGMDGRVNGTLDTTLWGIGYPLLME
jgi:hypothetical protein